MSETAENSLYRREAPIGPDFPVFKTSGRAGIVVIGGGLTGLSTALHLAEQGEDVAVLEAETVGWGASGRNGGQLNPGLKYDPSWFIEAFGEERGQALIDFGWSTVDETSALIERLGLDCELRRKGTLRAVLKEADAAAVRKTFEDMASRGMPVDWLDRQGVAELVGHEHYTNAMLDRRGGDLNPLLYTRQLAVAAQATGAQIYEKSRVSGLAKVATGFELKMNGASLKADRVLLACNGYADGLYPGLSRAGVPVFSSVLASNPLPADLAASIMPGRQVLYEAGLITVYYRVDERGRLVIGGRGPQRHSASQSDMKAVEQHAYFLWPELAKVGWQYAWNGRICMTQDHLPHLHAPEGGLLIAYGYNGRGVALATAMGKRLADCLGGKVKTEDFVLPPSELKTIPFHAFWPLGVHATVTFARLKAALTG